jgi:hypothetical protein
LAGCAGGRVWWGNGMDTFGRSEYVAGFGGYFHSGVGPGAMLGRRGMNRTAEERPRKGKCGRLRAFYCLSFPTWNETNLLDDHARHDLGDLELRRV